MSAMNEKITKTVLGYSATRITCTNESCPVNMYDNYTGALTFEQMFKVICFFKHFLKCNFSENDLCTFTVCLNTIVLALKVFAVQTVQNHRRS